MKKLLCIFVVSITVGCGFPNMLPSKSRDQWYMAHVKETNFVNEIKIGMTKEQVLSIAGEPKYKRTEDALHEPIDEWIYPFQHFSDKVHVRFEDGKVSTIRSY